MGANTTISIISFDLAREQSTRHRFAAQIQMPIGSPPPAATVYTVYGFNITGNLTQQEHEELDSLRAKITERIKREFKGGFS